MPDSIVIIFAALLGAVAGSFLNVVIYRLPRKESIAFPASHCPSCGEPIRARDNVPIISYLLLLGRCRACKARIPARYPIVEALTALLWALAAWRFGFTPALPAALYFVSVLVAISFIDWEHYIIPNKIVLPSIVVGLALALLQGLGSFTGGLVGLLIGGGSLFLLAMIYPKGMGGGDVKLAAFMGVILNFYVLIALFGAFLLGAVGGIALMAAGLRGRYIPFGPFLALGSLIALYFGPQLWDFYKIALGVA